MCDAIDCTVYFSTTQEATSSLRISFIMNSKVKQDKEPKDPWKLDLNAYLLLKSKCISISRKAVNTTPQQQTRKMI